MSKRVWLLLALMAATPPTWLRAQGNSWQDLPTSSPGGSFPGSSSPYSSAGPGSVGAGQARSTFPEDRPRARLEIHRAGDRSRIRGAPVFGPGDEAVVRVVLAWRPGMQVPGSLTLTVRGGASDYSATAWRSLASSSGPSYEARIPIDDLGGGGGGTVNQSFAAFRTTPSQDSKVFRDTLKGQPSPAVLPSREVSFLDQQAYLEARRAGQSGPSEGAYQVAGRELFGAGGVESRSLQVQDPSGETLVTGSLSLRGQADWMYFSGHYPYTSGGLLNGDSIDPFTVTGQGWEDQLEVLIFAACYAVDINAGEGTAVSHGRGVHGSLWWRKFRGTLLGYRGSAPSSGIDARIVRRFLERMKASRVSPSDQPAYSRELAETWMDVNTREHGALDAAAVDASGRYYVVNRRGLNLRGLQTRSQVRWSTVEQAEWEPGNQQLIQDFELERQIFQPVRALQWEAFGGRPPSTEQVLSDPAYVQAASAAGRDPRDPLLVQKVSAFLEYERHIFFDVPRPDYYQRAVSWLAARQVGSTPLTVEDVERHFTPSGDRDGASRLARPAIAQQLFRHDAWEVASGWVFDRQSWQWRHPSSDEVRATLTRRHQLDADAEAYLSFLDRYVSRAGGQQGAE